MNLKTIAILLAVPALCILTGCGPSVTHKGAYPLFPEATADSSSAWIYIDASDKDFTGVYRCTDKEGKVMCRRAPLIVK